MATELEPKIVSCDMSRQLTTSLSDAVLTISSLLAILRLHNASSNWHLHLLASTMFIEETPVFGITCFILIALASTLGTVRFAFSGPSHSLVSAHKRASWWAAVVGFTFLAANYNFAYRKFSIGWFHALNVIIVYLALKILPHKVSKAVITIQQVTSFMSIGGLCITNHNWQGAIGIHLVIVAAVIIGTDGTVMGMPAVDVFHYVLTCGVYLLSHGLVAITWN